MARDKKDDQTACKGNEKGRKEVGFLREFFLYVAHCEHDLLAYWTSVEHHRGKKFSFIIVSLPLHRFGMPDGSKDNPIDRSDRWG